MATSPIETVRNFVTAFIAAWPAADADAVAGFFADDAAYYNGPLEPIFGRPAIRDAIAGFMAMDGTVEVDIVRLAAAGATVMTERVDYFVTTEGKMSLPVVGVFEVHAGEITAWRDYFDLNTFTAHLKV